MANFQIQRLLPDHASLISDCTRRVYGSRYAHEMFYDIDALMIALESGELLSVGALDPQGELIAHMAMTNRGPNSSPELGNTMVDPRARGDGLAWKVGAELVSWCRELGHGGFLHYPTTEHAIMQKQSVKNGFETGLMLSYIPGESGPRQAATVVYEPLGSSSAQTIYVPSAYQSLLQELAQDCQLDREMLKAPGQSSGDERFDQTTSEARGLGKFTVFQWGSTLEAKLTDFAHQGLPCLHLDLVMDDPGMFEASERAKQMGFVFCAWLPGYQGADVLRLQKWQTSDANESPELANQRAVSLLNLMLAEHHH